MPETENTVVQPGQVIRPFIDLELSRKLVKNLYGLTVVSGSELISYDDRNFHIQVTEDVDNKHISKPNPHGYVLKILNALDSKHEDFVEAQTLMILHLVKHGVRTPEPVLNVHGQLMSLESVPANRDIQEKGDSCDGHNILCMVRLFEYIPGKTLTDVSFTPQLMFQVGEITGQLDHSLTTFHHPAHDKHRRIWCLSEVNKLNEFAYCITEESQRAIVDDVISTFEKEVMGNHHSLSKGTIHGDVNDNNILVQVTTDKADSATEDDVSVAGILDFGDSVYSCYVFELAIMMCYVILRSDPCSRLHNAGHALAGYLLKFALNSNDLSIVKECICARLVTSLVMGKYSANQDPENSEYLLVTQQKGWDCLTQLWSLSNKELFAMWRKTVSLYGIELNI